MSGWRQGRVMHDKTFVQEEFGMVQTWFGEARTLLPQFLQFYFHVLRPGNAQGCYIMQLCFISQLSAFQIVDTTLARARPFTGFLHFHWLLPFRVANSFEIFSVLRILETSGHIGEPLVFGQFTPVPTCQRRAEALVEELKAKVV